MVLEVLPSRPINLATQILIGNLLIFIAALSLPRHLPPLNIQSRWHSEPIRLLSLDAQVFLRNAGGYPVLSQPHRALVTRYMRIRNPPWILLCDVGPIPGLNDPNAIVPMADGFLSPNATKDAEQMPTPAEAALTKNNSTKKPKDPTPHLSYIRNLQRKQPPRSDLERFSIGYQDYLQAPLQPLTDNLESVTYEVFEKDPIKYDLYEKAIALALEDWVKQGKPASGSEGRVIVAVVGAGRGPLVSRAIQASETVGVEIEIWAVEKNPNAYVLLQRHNEEDWDGRVNLVKSDMRSWKGPLRQISTVGSHSPQNSEDRYSADEVFHEPMHEPLGVSSSSLPPTASQSSARCPIDILISELLGSFADNELSPECLDGILPLLNPTHGISIPASYTAYLSPINAPKLHADISARSANDPSAPNTPYVVMLHAVDHLSSTTPPATSENIPLPIPNILRAWSFTHAPSPSIPPSSLNRHNTRHARLTFRTRDRGVCHGLAGYFEAVLYPGVELSTNPLTMEAKSAGMMSWFPIFFPLKVTFFQILIVNIGWIKYYATLYPFVYVYQIFDSAPYFIASLPAF